MRTRPVRVLAIVLGVLVLLAGIAAFVMFGPPAVAERLAEPSFCASCHLMDPQYEAFRGSIHRNLDSCNDCHLPNDSFVRHWFWDGVVGIRDLVKFNLNVGIPEYMDARDRSRDWIQENCVRCHQDVVDHMQQQGGRCWECHREMYHRLDNGRLAKGQPTGAEGR